MKLSNNISAGIGLVCIFSLLGCGEQEGSAKHVVEMPTFQHADLMAGRGVWQRTCRACHLLGVDGAPAVTNFVQWEYRLRKGNDILAQRVIDGIRGDDGAYRMSPRGGNDRLTDEQVKLAVDYKIASIKALKHQSE